MTKTLKQKIKETIEQNLNSKIKIAWDEGCVCKPLEYIPIDKNYQKILSRITNDIIELINKK